MTYALSGALGATEWGTSQYEAIARATAAQQPGSFLLVQVGRNGLAPRTATYGSHAALMAAWDQLALGPDVAYAIAFDKTLEPDYQIVETKINPTIETLVRSQINWRSLAPWAAAAGVIVAGAVLFTRAPKRGAPKRRRGARFGWRRRTVTVWR